MPSVSETFAEAVKLHQSGNLEPAETLYQNVLRVDPGHADALHLIGVAAHQRRRHKEAVDYIRRAIKRNRSAAMYHYNLGNAYRDLDRLDKARRAYRRAIELQPEMADAHFALGNILGKQGQADRAAECFYETLRLRPDYANAHYNLGNLYLGRRELQKAVEHYERALALRPDDAGTLKNLAEALQAQYRQAEAAEYLERLMTLRDDDPGLYNNYANVLKSRGKFQEAETYYRKAIALRPDSGAYQTNLGTVLQEQSRLTEALEAYQRAVELNPKLGVASGNLASLLERLNRLDDAQAAAERGLSVDPANVLCNLICAKADRRQKRYRAGIDRLEGLDLSREPTDVVRSVEFELGRLYEGLRDSDNAFAHFLEGNRLAGYMYEAHGCDRSVYLHEIDALQDFFAGSDPARWTPTPPFPANETPYFLIGFPRSGTTLLDQILDSHPRLQTLEEKPTARAMKRWLSDHPKQYPGALPHLGPDDFEDLRQVYFETVDQYLDRDPDKRLIDKMPLSLINVGLIRRVFPRAKFIVAIRHPCDVCLSCFMQDFKANSAMANFLTLAGAAEAYAKVMSLWQQYARWIPGGYHIVRYEDVVADLEGEARRLLEFLDVEWDDRVLQYNEHARRRKHISTTSYYQVTEPIYRRARYRWKRYSRHFEPLMDRLQPFIEFFGYAEAAEPDPGNADGPDSRDFPARRLARSDEPENPFGRAQSPGTRTAEALIGPASGSAESPQRPSGNAPPPGSAPEADPQPLRLTSLDDLNALNFYCYRGRRDVTQQFRALVAGDGSGDAVLYLAHQLRHSDAELIYLDPGGKSGQAVRDRARRHNLDERITWLQGSLPDLPQMDLEPVDYINCAGALDHLDDPTAALQALKAVLKEEGALGVLLYGQYGRTGIEPLQQLVSLIHRNEDDPHAKRDVTRTLLNSLPQTNEFRRRFPQWTEADGIDDGELDDLLLGGRDRSWTIGAVYELLDRAGLRLAEHTVNHRLLYRPEFAFRDPGVLETVRQLPRRQQEAAAEIYWGAIDRHAFWATSRPDTMTDRTDPENVPFFTRLGEAHRVRDSILRTEQGNWTLQLAHRGGISVTLGFQPVPAVRRFVELIDGWRTMGEIVERLRPTFHPPPDPQDIWHLCLHVMEILQRYDLLLLRHRSVPMLPSV